MFIERAGIRQIEIDPEVVAVHDVAMKLLEVYRKVQDPVVKHIYKEMSFDALSYAAEVRLKSKARKASEFLKSAVKPQINWN